MNKILIPLAFMSISTMAFGQQKLQVLKPVHQVQVLQVEPPLAHRISIATNQNDVEYNQIQNRIVPTARIKDTNAMKTDNK